MAHKNTKHHTPADKKYANYTWQYKAKHGTHEGMRTREEWNRRQILKGHDLDNVKDLRAGKDPNYYSRLRFARHRAQAKYRNISFEFDWESWHAWWLSHGIDRNIPTAERGGQRLCMCRYKDSGPYRLDNVYLATQSQNSSDARLGDSPTGRPPGSKNKPKVDKNSTTR